MADQTLHGTNTRGATRHMGSTDTYNSQVHANQHHVYTPHHVFVQQLTESSEITHYIKLKTHFCLFVLTFF